MFNLKIQIAVLSVCCALAAGAVADDFDGSRSLAGVTGKIVELNAHRVIEDVDPDTIGLPKKFVIDFDSKRILASKDSPVQKSIPFKGVDHVENKLVIQGVDEGVEGVEDGLAWSLTISKKNGKAVLSASGDGVAYVVFGVCTPLDKQ